MLYGKETERAIENFPLSGRPVHPELIHAYGTVKLACFLTNKNLGFFPDPKKADAIELAIKELTEGKLDAHLPVDALQGGAGTSTNFSVNEVIANRALEILGASKQLISPTDDINLHQSTNDTYPTALKLAAVTLLKKLETNLVALQESFQEAEKKFAHVVKVGRTEMQDAVLTTLGREMSCYAEAVNRDRWRVYKCEERLRVVNLGGTAIGTGIAAPREYIFRVTETLRDLTGIGFARAENLVEATQNADVYVEVSGILKACASNLMKISSDLRFLASGPESGIGEIRLPVRQAGSTIMPGKANPVIPEAVSQCAMLVMGYDSAIFMAASSGHLELNPFLPLIADSLLHSIGILSNAANILKVHCVDGIEADETRCRRNVENSTAVLTALVPKIGYDKASAVWKKAKDTGKTVREAVLEEKLISPKELDEILTPEAVLRLGS